MRRRRHLPRASGGHQSPHPGRLSFPQHGYGTLEPRSAASAAPRAPRTWAARGAPIRHLCIVGTVAPRRGPFGHVRLALSLPWTWCRRWTAPGGLVAPFDPGDRPILKGSVTHWPKSSNRRREFISRTRRLRRLIRELFRRSREFRSSSDHGTGARADGPPCRRAVKTPREPFRAAEPPARGLGPGKASRVRSEIRSRSTSANSAKSVVMTFVWMLLLPSTRMFSLSATKATPALARASRMGDRLPDLSAGGGRGDDLGGC